LPVFVRGGRLALLSLAVVVSLADLTGCGGGGSKPVSLPALSSTSSSPSPSTTSSQTDLDAVSAVVRRWFSLLASQTSLQTAVSLESITTSSCKCRNAPRSVRDAVAKHERYVGTSHIISFVASMDGASAGHVPPGGVTRVV
jgi:hypothetical protein